MHPTLINLDSIVRAQQPINENLNPIYFRRAKALSHFSKSIFHPIPLVDSLRGKGTLVPKDYQLLPLEAFNTPWLSSLSIEPSSDGFSPRDTFFSIIVL